MRLLDALVYVLLACGLYLILNVVVGIVQGAVHAVRDWRKWKKSTNGGGKK